uniref:AAA family ATPase n=1 Tax=uncultured Cohaesibacter sp. TaxID=1002546 RepID=UPI00292F80EE
LEKNRLLVCDTDLVSSLVYNRHYYKDEMNTPRWAMWEQWAEQHKKRLKSEPHAPRLYILCDIDWPWVDDGQRDEPDKRDYFRKCFEEELKAQECDFLVARGSLEERLRAVLAHLVQLPAKR